MRHQLPKRSVFVGHFDRSSFLLMFHPLKLIYYSSGTDGPTKGPQNTSREGDLEIKILSYRSDAIY